MKYRKKPVVVEAVQWTGINLEEIKAFVGDSLKYHIIDTAYQAGKNKPHVLMSIRTLEGNHNCSEGDYIIKGVKGEFYPCKPDIFALTYELAEDRPEDDYSGLKVKYRVYKARNNEPVENCFVLRPDKDPAAVEALRAYASATENGQLAKDIIDWIGQPAPLTLEQLRSWTMEEPLYIKLLPPGAHGRWEMPLKIVQRMERLVCKGGTVYFLDDYGKTWTAYTQRPEEAAP